VKSPPAATSRSFAVWNAVADEQLYPFSKVPSFGLSKSHAPAPSPPEVTV
jgi:hypothetical protein